MYVEDQESKLTPMAYVCEQYMSPRKKSRNSTGMKGERSNRNCTHGQSRHHIQGSFPSRLRLPTIRDCGGTRWDRERT